MQLEEIRFIEHLALDSPLALREFCHQMARRFQLPEFHFDCENETEWGLVVQGDIEYNVSCPYEEGTLQEWDDTVPAGCNFGIMLMVSKNCPADWNTDWACREVVLQIGQGLADLFARPVYHHRTWLGPGNNLTRRKRFAPR